MTGSADERQRIAEAILSLLGERALGKSICPSEVARALEPAEERWRRLMKPVRTEAARLAGEGQVTILRHGKPIDPRLLKGVIRLARGPRWPGTEEAVPEAEQHKEPPRGPSADP